MNLRIEPQQVTQTETTPLTLKLPPKLLQRLDWACERIQRTDGQPSDRDYTAMKYLEAILPNAPKKSESKTKDKKGAAKPQDGAFETKPHLAKQAVA